MLENIFQSFKALELQISELPQAQQASFTQNLEFLSNSLQELAATRVFESATKNAAKLVELEKSNRLLERMLAQQASQMRRLQEELQKEIRQHRLDNQGLIKNEAKLQTVLRNSPDIISIIESDGRVRYHSEAVERILGYQAQERIGKVHGELIHPEDLLAWQAYFGKLLEHRGIAKPIEYRMRHADGSWVYMEAVGNSLLQDYNVNGIVMSSREIGERKQAELAIKESEFHYRIMSQITSDFAYSFRVTADGKFVCEWVTEAFARCTGRLPEELTAGGWWSLELAHPDDRKMLLEQLTDCTSIRTGKNEYRILNKTGEVRWVRDCWQVVWDKTEGRIVRLWGACQEITDRKQVELQLQLAKELLQAQIESAPLAIICTDTKGQVTVWNPMAEKIFGWSAKQVLEQIEPNIPEGKEQDFEAILKSMFNGKVQNGCEVSLLKKDGGSIDLWLFATPVQDASGQTIGCIKIFSDLSERKRIESERQKLVGLQNMEEPFWVRYITPPTNTRKIN
ncbi:PAS domain S-box protein [Microcoleus anatoxicus]|uniref:PAS domain-containing protein n=1 Tax=Microcoleus anatoxicus TaxID=2705319 RepID=UPI0030CA07A1